MQEKTNKVVTQFPTEEVKAEECLSCGGSGRTATNPFHCDDCGKDYERKSRQETIDNSRIYIPHRYRKNAWNKEEVSKDLLKNVKDIQIRGRILKWVEVQELLLKMVEMGKPLIGSFYLSAPKNTGKTRWVYNMLTTAEDKNYQIHEIMEAIDMDFELDKLMEPDILVIRLSNYKIKEAMEKLNYIMPKRNNRDLMTIIYSEMPLTYVNKFTDYVTFEVQEIAY